MIVIRSNHLYSDLLVVVPRAGPTVSLLVVIEGWCFTPPAEEQTS